MKTNLRITPGAGKVAVEKIELSQELPIKREDGTIVRLKVLASDNHEGTVARVVAVCKPWSTVGEPDRVFNPEYSVGEIVLIGKWTGTRLAVDRDEFIVLREEDVLCTIDREPEIMLPTVGEETLETDLENPVDAATATL